MSEIRDSKTSKFTKQQFHQIHDNLHEECAIDGTFLGLSIYDFGDFPATRNRLCDTAQIILDALEQQYINDLDYMNAFKKSKENIQN